MNKNDLIDAVARQTELAKKEAAKAIEAMLETITGALQEDEEVRLVGFGTFSVSHRSGGKSRNPRTGQEMMIPPTKTPRFKAGKSLKQAIA